MRPDCIYISERVELFTFYWVIKESAIPTDHTMVSVRYTPKEAPQIGKGQWMLPLSLLRNEKLLEKIAEQGIKFQTETTRDWLEQTDRQTANVQTYWEAYKNNIHKLAKEAAKGCYHKITSHITALEKDLRETNNKPDISTNRKTQTHKAILTSQLKHLKKKDVKNRSDLMKVKLANHGKCLGGMWSALGKEKRLRSLIHRLRIPNTNPPQYECSLKRMAELACNHHNTLQSKDIDLNMSIEEYNMLINDILNKIPESQHLEDPDRTMISWKITEKQVSKALQCTKDSTATGLDGCLYKLWKALEKRHNNLQQKNVPSFNVIKAFTYLF